MKERLKRILAGIIAVYVIFAALPPIAVNAAPATYSKTSNSGTRDEVCTSLDGTSASSYYTGDYEYEDLVGLSASALQTTLHNLMTNTHKYISSYDDCHYKADKTDCENGNGKVVLLYTSYSATMSQWDGWNREHVWPKSLGGGNTSGGGADLHHIRPSDAGVNSSRGNKKYGESGSNPSEKYGTDPATGVLGGTYNSSYFEPLDNVKGDVARICLYVWVRWGSDWGAESVTEVFQSVDILLEWCALDPVDTWEMGRNEVIQNIQGNRNVFIDYPELAWQLFGREAPENMSTPSMNASNGNVGSGSGGGDGSGGGSGSVGGGDNQPSVTTIANIKAATSGNYTTEGTVVARNAQSYLIADNTGVMMVFVKAMPDVEVGDKVRVSGQVTVYGGATQFANGAIHTKLGTEAINYPTPKKLTGADCDAYVDNVVLDYVKVVGTLSTSGSGTKTYYNLAIDGATLVGSVTYPENTSALAALVGKEVELTGYVTGITGSTTQYLNFMATALRENTATECTHETTKLVGASEAVCGTNGYTGDTYCTVCNEKLATGSVIEATGEHSFGEWTSADGYEERKCTVCDYTEVRNNDCKHTNTEVRGIKKTSCREAGYTGDTYCKDCGAKLSGGVSVAKTGHSYGDATIVKEPTATEEGISRKICSVCGTASDEAIPVKSSVDTSVVIVAVGVGGVGLIVALIFLRKYF